MGHILGLLNRVWEANRTRNRRKKEKEEPEKMDPAISRNRYKAIENHERNERIDHGPKGVEKNY